MTVTLTNLYADRFVEIVREAALRLKAECFLRKSRGGVDLRFRENDLRDRLRGIPDIVVEQRLQNDDNSGNVDYHIMSHGRVVATCEVKGPVRKSFLDPSRFGRNWSKRFTEDLQKQAKRAASMPDAEHYSMLLLPFTEETLNASHYTVVIERARAQVPQATILKLITSEVHVHTDVLTIVLFRVGLASTIVTGI